MKIEDPISELHSTRPYMRLVELDSEYAEKATIFLQNIAPVLATTIQHFPYYTRHDAHHGFRVLRRVEQIVKEECFNAGESATFAATDIFLIILAAYAHDLGMTVFPGEEDDILKALGIDKIPGWETAPQLQSYLRREHSKRGGDYIAKYAADLGVPHNLVGPLDLIMQSHNLSITDLERKISTEFAAREEPLNVRQLAVIICVADALEFSDTRVIEGVVDALAHDPSPEARVSHLENMKHVYIGDSLLIRREDGRVVISGTFLEADVLGLAHHTLDQIESWIRGYCDIDRTFKVPRLLIRSEPFTRNLAFRGGRFERLGVRLNKRNVIDLIASNAVWRDQGGVAVREILQNAIEACRYRLHHSGEADAYEPKVTVDFDRGRHEIIISDNGCGMSERVVLNNLLTVGSSRSAEPGYSTERYAPIAKFGVGFWSVFTIAESANIETASFEPHRGDPDGSRSADGFSFEVSLDEMKEFTVFKTTSRPCGTTVRLKLRDNIQLDELFASSMAQIVCLEIPTTFQIDGDQTEVPNDLPDVSTAELFGARMSSIDRYNIGLFPWRGVKGNTELSLLIPYRIQSNKPTFMIDDSNSMLQALPMMRSSSTSICGFRTQSPHKNLCIDLDRVGMYKANRRSPHGIQFSLDRGQLISNAASEEFAQEIADLFHDGYREFLKQTDGSDLPTVAALREQAAMHGGNVYDSFTGKELSRASSSFPDLAPVRLYPLMGGDPIYVRVDELSGMQGRVFIPFEERYFLGALGRERNPYASHSTLQALRNAILDEMGEATPVYAMQVDRSGAWLFDADPESSVVFLQPDDQRIVGFMVVNLGRVDTSCVPNVLVEVRGHWSGGIYLRDFKAPLDKSYVFLGRHRVLIKRGSKLAAELAELSNLGRRTKIAEIIAELKEDSQGFSNPAIEALLT